MNFYLLDAGAPGLIFAVLIVFMIIIVILEWVIMILLKYNKAGKAFTDSLLINLFSMGVGYIILFTRDELFDMTDSVLLNVFILFAITVVAEFGLLYLLNKTKPVQKTLLTTVIINLASYIIYYLLQVN